MYYNVIQFGPARSGSTLCFNAIRALLPEARVKKAHAVKLRYLWRPMVVTLRDPFDSVMSMVKKTGKEIDDDLVRHQAEVLYQNGFETLARVPRSALILRYEEFYGNTDWLLSQISEYLSVDAPQDVQESFAAAFGVETVYAATRDRAWSTQDDGTRFRGRHVSDDLGRPGSGDVLTTRQREIVFDTLRLHELRGPAGDTYRSSYL